MIMKDTEGSKNIPKIDLALFEPCNDGCPYLCFSLPSELWNGLHEHYNGAGCFSVDLKDILDEFLATYWGNSHGEYTMDVIIMLRDYADRIESDLKINNEEGGDCC